MKNHIGWIAGAGVLTIAMMLPAQSRNADSLQSRDARSSSSGGASAYREHYGVIYEHNIFIKDRRKPTTAPATTRPAPPRQPEQTLMLTGVVYEPLEGKAYAFFEDLSAGTIMRTEVGDKVARGTIAAIDIDIVAYDRDGKLTPVAVGQDLTGARASAGSSSRSSTSSATTSPATSAPAIDPKNPNLSLEERMRLRRQQERR
jgi:hypothetical protein